jgi:hypothetical protein
MTPVEKSEAYRQRRIAAAALMPKVPCQCGCGETIPPITKALKPARYKVGHAPGGEATRFKKGDSENGRRGAEALRKQGRLSGSGHANWKGGESRDRTGYVRCTITKQQAALWPTATLNSYRWSIMRSHKVWNLAHPGDVVTSGYQVHHLNGIRDDDRPENLQKLSIDDHYAVHTALGSHKVPRPAGRTACPSGHPHAQYRRVAPSGTAWCAECSRLKTARYRATAKATAA